MQQKTISALNRINRDFYDRFAAEFSATRHSPWPGWTQLLSTLTATRPELGTDLGRVLDVGCGNGRFERFLSQQTGLRFDYTGIDSCERLLELAATSTSSQGSWQRIDLIADAADLPTGPFRVVTVLALLHHLPSFALRRCLLARLCDRLEPDGFLAISHWQLSGISRLERRTIDWGDHNALASQTINIGDLEPGDRLLAWGQEGPEADPLARRYCHHTSAEEARRLVQDLSLHLVAEFAADGPGDRANLYQVLKKSA